MQSNFETIEFLDSKEDQYFRHKNSIKSMTLTQLKDKTKNLTSEINIRVRFTEQSNEWGDYAPNRNPIHSYLDKLSTRKKLITLNSGAPTINSKDIL